MKRYFYSPESGKPTRGRSSAWRILCGMIVVVIIAITLSRFGGIGRTSSAPDVSVDTTKLSADDATQRGAVESTKQLGVGEPPRTLQSYTRAFTPCGAGSRDACVVDGDTIWLDGVKIRIADIDTPEIRQPKCESEKVLGQKATKRLLALLNEAEFQLASVGDRDEDAFGRKLRVIVRDGKSLGDQLVREGLARTWAGRREAWC